MSDQEFKFRGSVVWNAFTNGFFWEQLIVRTGEATLRPWLREATTVARKDVEAVEFVRVRLPLFWRTLVRFRCNDGSLVRRKFIPARTERVREAFVTCLWPIRELDWRQEAMAKLRRHKT